MKKPIKIVLVTLALAGGPLITGCVVAPRGGEVAFGYSDGYWDRDHHWHAWRSSQDAAQFRAANRDHYYDRRHDEDRDQGWHDNDRYWQRH
jgi:hypothetical protein